MFQAQMCIECVDTEYKYICPYKNVWWNNYSSCSFCLGLSWIKKQRITQTAWWKWSLLIIFYSFMATGTVRTDREVLGTDLYLSFVGHVVSSTKESIVSSTLSFSIDYCLFLPSLNFCLPCDTWALSTWQSLSFNF